MNDIVIPEITISLRDLVNAILLYLACLGVVMVASRYREWLKAAIWRRGSIYWILTVISVAVFLPAIWETLRIVTGNGNIFDRNPRKYVMLFATITGPLFIIWRMYIAHYQTNTAEEDSITERVDKAIDSLGSVEVAKKDAEAPPEPNIKARLAAIYSLERVAQESPRSHVKIMETLCLYIQSNSKADTATLLPENSQHSVAAWRERVPPVRIDIQASIDVIARRNDAQILNEITEKYTLDLRECNLQRVNFRTGKFDLASMEECHLDFAQMDGTELNGAVLNRATLNGAKLEGARLNGAELNGAKLNEANLDRAELNGAKCNGAELNGAMLRLAKLNGAVLVGAKLHGADLNGVAINRAVANGADLRGAKLNGAMLKEAVLNQVMFNGAELNGAELNRAALNRAVLIGAELNGAKLDGVNFSGANMERAAVKSTDLSGAVRLSEMQLNALFGDQSTTLPAGMKRPDGWPEDDLDYSEFYTQWQAAKKEAGLP